MFFFGSILVWYMNSNPTQVDMGIITVKRTLIFTTALTYSRFNANFIDSYYGVAYFTILLGHTDQ